MANQESPGEKDILPLMTCLWGRARHEHSIRHEAYRHQQELAMKTTIKAYEPTMKSVRWMVL